MPDSKRQREVTERADLLLALIPPLRVYARALAGGIRDRADDLVQEAAARILAAPQAPALFDEFRPWAFTILRNLFLSEMRRRTVEARAAARLEEEMVPLSPDAESQAAAAQVLRRLATLTPLLREALVLVGAEQLSYQEAAVICGVPEGTMKARVSRARRQLAAMLPS
jgi:RNA polymerase sigma-70 factor (ECF subfamily)